MGSGAVGGSDPLDRARTIALTILTAEVVVLATLLKWLVMHAVVLGGAMILLLGVAWRRGGAPGAPPSQPADVQVPVDA